MAKSDRGDSARAGGRPLLVCLHWLGGSARSWDLLKTHLSSDIDVMAIDLPGFGDAAQTPGAPVAEMAEAVVERMRALQPRTWMLAGHSMGAKVALAVARLSEDGEPVLAGLSHLILLAGSPPAPEPMDESTRQEMLGWFADDAERSRAEAQTMIDRNVGAPLEPATNEATAAELLRLNRDAWVAWLERGSREDWAERIGLLRTPALIVAGEKDADLGPDGQKRLMARHFVNRDLVVLPGAGHLLPVEQPERVARLVAAHLGFGSVPPHYRAFIASDRVSARVKALMAERSKPDDPDRQPMAMSPAQLTVLRAVVDRVLPQPEPRIDIAARMDQGLGSEPGDGWRFADLPSDQETYRLALDTLQAMAAHRHGGRFALLAASDQDALLSALPDGKGSRKPALPGQLSPHQMALWFEDVRANTVRVYMSHPLAMARYGFSGIGYGGDGERLQGFTTVGLGETEAWEPRAMENGR